MKKSRIITESGRPFYGMDVGIILLDTAFPRPPGDVAHAETFSFPVLYEVIEGATPQLIVEQAENGLLEPVVEGVNRLVKRGVRGVATCCGFLALYQRELSAVATVPVATSSLLQISQVLQLLAPESRVGVITANSTTLDHRYFDAVGITSEEQSRLHIIGLENTGHLYHTLIEDGDLLDTDRAEAEVIDTALSVIRREPTISAFVLECTNLPPYAAAIQAATQRPVFDNVTLIKWLRDGVNQTNYL